MSTRYTVYDTASEPLDDPAANARCEDAAASHSQDKKTGRCGKILAVERARSEKNSILAPPPNVPSYKATVTRVGKNCEGTCVLHILCYGCGE